MDGDPDDLGARPVARRMNLAARIIATLVSLGVAERIITSAIGWIDWLAPKHDEVVLRTGPDFEDQGRELVAALSRAGEERVTWLVSGDTDPGPAGPVSAAVVPALSLAGARAFWRARVVVHTHGVYGSRRASRRKTFVNMWHGMPIKRLEAGSDVGRFQTDLTPVTSSLHGEHLAETWGLGPEQVLVTGLPRNDVLLARSGEPRPAALRELAGDRPLVVWLPTFRASVAGAASADGVETGTVSQLEGGTPDAVDEALGRLGAFGIIKAHPLAPRPTRASRANLEIWSEEDLRASGLTLYGLLAHADILVTDHSSVWIDFLLTRRPIAFAISDLEQYQENRGFYFDSIPDLLPGPLSTDLPGLERDLGALLSGDDPFTDARRRALECHHTHQDGGSADRLVAAVMHRLRGRAPRP